MVSTRTGRDCPNTVTNTTARAMPGKDITMSKSRISTSEVHLPEVAAMAPNTAAASKATAVDARPITSEELAP